MPAIVRHRPSRVNATFWGVREARRRDDSIDTVAPLCSPLDLMAKRALIVGAVLSFSVQLVNLSQEMFAAPFAHTELSVFR